MYAVGEGVPEDDRQAARWYHKAAEQGRARGQFNLGLIYAKGEGVPEDYIRAYAWSSLAAAQGHKKAGEVKSLLRGGMTREQIADAQALSRRLCDQVEAARGTR